MTAAKSSDKDYVELETELQAVIDWFESDTFDVDQAVQKYQRGLELVKKLEQHLDAAENTVRQLKAKFETRTK